MSSPLIEASDISEPNPALSTVGLNELNPITSPLSGTSDEQAPSPPSTSRGVARSSKITPLAARVSPYDRRFRASKHSDPASDTVLRRRSKNIGISNPLAGLPAFLGESPRQSKKLHKEQCHTPPPAASMSTPPAATLTPPVATPASPAVTPTPEPCIPLTPETMELSSPQPQAPEAVFTDETLDDVMATPNLQEQCTSLPQVSPDAVPEKQDATITLPTIPPVEVDDGLMSYEEFERIVDSSTGRSKREKQGRPIYKPYGSKPNRKTKSALRSGSSSRHPSKVRFAEDVCEPDDISSLLSSLGVGDEEESESDEDDDAPITERDAVLFILDAIESIQDSSR